jgi:predicted RNA polymerase sigma factor
VDDARQAYAKAIALTAEPGVRAYLEGRQRLLGGAGGLGSAWGEWR